ncbi:hypothetical protein DNTS_004716 [Danionella cerebrum]|uniref:IMS import disulfide relay-system CHCH-CHCH-like Cx9C domain-containing protein n=1 Tax=Danionella cerebrum TaxID=2873325 RepID=A0A553MU91_9TELE|nr:hypothetical protein DNTS_004716 [Danionella translucida]
MDWSWIYPVVRLKEAAMAIVSRFCQKELDEYGGCVAAHPESWQEKCADLKLKVAQCTSSQYEFLFDSYHHLWSRNH